MNLLTNSIRKIALLIGCCLFAIPAWASIDVTGVVRDDSGEPVTGANVVIKGTTTGTVTDIEGKYRISVPDEQVVLQFSFVGYTTIEETVGSRKIIDVILEESSTSLESVVVIGYGSTVKTEITGSSSSVKSDNFNQGAFTSPIGMLQGKVAGLTIINPDGGDPQSKYEFLLRGTNTLTSGQSPLVIIDGVVGTDLRNINFQEVVSIDVLKDGSAAAIYGTRGTNGVIIVTTKRAKEGKTQVEYSGQVSLSVNPQMVENLSASEFADVINKYKPISAGSIYTGDTDWYKEVSRSLPVSYKNSLAISGGTAKFAHRTTFDMEHQDGLQKRNEASKVLLRSNITQSAFNGWLDVNYNIFYSVRKYAPKNTDVFYQAFIHNPTEPVYDPANTESGGYNRIIGVSYYNPVAMVNEFDHDLTTDTYGGNARFSLNVLPVKGLKWDNFISYEKSRWDEEKYRTHYYPSTIGSNGVATIGNGSEYNLQYESTVNYTNTFGKHYLQGLLGYSYGEIGSKESEMINRGFDTDLLGTNDMEAGAGLKEGKGEMTSKREDNKLISFFGRIMYNYQSKYLISASIRREGSSRFGDNNKWGWFPAASVGWRITEEEFMKGIGFINDLKLRFGYGVTGNQSFDNYKSLLLMGVSGKFYYNGEWINTYQPISNPNPNLRWEKKHEMNGGLDFSFIGDRIGGSIDVYYRKSTDLLYKYMVPVPPYLYPEMYTNVGAISNKGVELTLYGKPYVKTFTWTTFVTAARNVNRLDKFTNDEFQNTSYKTGWLEGEIALYSQRMEEGKSLGTFYGPVWTGVDEFGEDKLKGQAPDGTVAEDKWKVIGHAYPDVTLGWSNNFGYKNWDFSFSLRASIGGDVLNKYRLYYENVNPIGLKNIARSWLDDPSFTGKSKYSSKYIENATYLKLDNIALGYTFIFKNNKYISSIKLYAAAQNVLTVTGYKGLDPEVKLTELEPGIESMTYYPRLTTVSFGIHAQF